MAWLATYGATNKVDLTKRTDVSTIANGFTMEIWTQTVTTEVYKYVGMTEAAAETCRATVNDPDNGVYAAAKKEGPGGNWMVDVTDVTRTSWATPV